MLFKRQIETPQHRSLLLVMGHILGNIADMRASKHPKAPSHPGKIHTLYPGESTSEFSSRNSPSGQMAIGSLTVSNEAGRIAYLDTMRIHTILATAKQWVCGLSPVHTISFLATNPQREVRGTLPQTYPVSPLHIFPAIQMPQTPPGRHPPLRREATLDSQSGMFSLALIRRYELPTTPLRLVRLCSGLAIGLETFLRAGYIVASYTWLGMDPNAHVETTHMISRPAIITHTYSPRRPPQDGTPAFR
jgi:hypothetical protein